MTKYIFVTGGVVSGLGKGITAASLGRLLKSRGYKVAAQKLDPYMNVDPGTMSPLQHGEVFVTEDGAETDLNLGHYERFIDENLNQFSNLTSGKTYWNVLNKERKGEYLGSTVQIIPHVTDEIKSFIYSVGKKSDADIVITEIGGTIGDIESQPFLEAIRQVKQEVGYHNSLFIHVTLVPYIKGSQEHKSKPTQHSVKELMAVGIAPDIIVTRSDEHLKQSIKNKIALFCNVKPDCVIENFTLPILYEVPLMLQEENMDTIVCRELDIPENNSNLSDWRTMLTLIHKCTKSVKIGLVGKYIALHDAYLSVIEALKSAGWENGVNTEISWFDSELITKENVNETLSKMDGIIIPGGFGDRGIEGMITTAEYARTRDIPFLGICLGMQIAVIEYSRNVLKHKDANSTEFNPNTTFPIIALMNEQQNITDKGGTMRLGSYPCKIKEGSKMEAIYETNYIKERHRHRYEVNINLISELEAKGLEIVGTSPDGKLAEAIELANNKFYFACQYHPEFISRPNRAEKAFKAFIKASIL